MGPQEVHLHRLCCANLLLCKGKEPLQHMKATDMNKWTRGETNILKSFLKVDWRQFGKYIMVQTCLNFLFHNPLNKSYRQNSLWTLSVMVLSAVPASLSATHWYSPSSAACRSTRFSWLSNYLRNSYPLIGLQTFQTNISLNWVQFYSLGKLPYKQKNLTFSMGQLTLFHWIVCHN